MFNRAGFNDAQFNRTHTARVVKIASATSDATASCTNNSVQRDRTNVKTLAADSTTSAAIQRIRKALSAIDAVTTVSSSKCLRLRYEQAAAASLADLSNAMQRIRKGISQLDANSTNSAKGAKDAFAIVGNYISVISQQFNRMAFNREQYVQVINPGGLVTAATVEAKGMLNRQIQITLDAITTLNNTSVRRDRKAIPAQMDAVATTNNNGTRYRKGSITAAADATVNTAAGSRQRFEQGTLAALATEVATNLRKRYESGQLDTTASTARAAGTRDKFDSALLAALTTTTSAVIRQRISRSTLDALSTIYAFVMPTFTETINKYERYIVPIVDVYFDGEQNAPTTFVGEAVDAISLLEEIKADGSTPLGTISANELYVSLANINRALSPTNSASPYYGKLRPNILIKAKLRVYATDEIYFDAPLGKFYTDDWNDQTDTTTANVRAYDRLYFMGSKEFAGTKLLKNVSYATLFGILFASMGLQASEYSIDSTLASTIVNLGWIPSGTFYQAAQFLSVASNSFVYVDREGVITVKRLSINFPVASKINDRNQIVRMSIPTAYYGTYSKLQIDVTTPVESSSDEVLHLTNVSCPTGTTILTNCSLSNTPVGNITQVLVKATNAKLSYYKASTHAITIEIVNSGAAENVEILVYGTPLSLSSQQLVTEDAEIKNIIGEKLLKISNPLVQSMAVAQAMSNDLFPIVTNPNMNIAVEIRGNPQLVPGTVVEATDDTDKVGTQKLLVYRHKLDFAGGLSGALQGFNIT